MKEVLPAIVKSQEDVLTILLGLKGHEVGKADEIFLDIDRYSFEHQELAHTVTEVKKV